MFFFNINDTRALILLCILVTSYVFQTLGIAHVVTGPLLHIHSFIQGIMHESLNFMLMEGIMSVQLQLLARRLSNWRAYLPRYHYIFLYLAQYSDFSVRFRGTGPYGLMIRIKGNRSHMSVSLQPCNDV